MQKKTKKIFFDFEIIAFELVSLNTRFYSETNNLCGSSSFSKYSKFYLDYWNAEDQKMFFDFQIIAFEYITLNTHFYWERILVTWC